jgi:hypothetical protein
MLELRHVTKLYSGIPAVRDISPTFAVAAGFPAGVNQKSFGYNAGRAEKH